jgi:2-oxo-4-hydroxy-4-carboxy-5-ureidoimidazoline decarboxylase
MASLADFNAAPADAAARDVLAWCASGAFAKLVTDGRPYPDGAALLAATGTAFESLTWDDILEAMDAHPRIGDSAVPPSSEQAGVAETDRAALAVANAAYERRFGHVFLICASGLSGQDMLAELNLRLENSFSAERAVARQELAKINRLRMTKQLGL